jgi:hypothetical protein
VVLVVKAKAVSIRLGRRGNGCVEVQQSATSAPERQ